MTTPAATIDPDKLEATVEQVFGYLGGAVISSMIYLGDHLGLYRALADADAPLTSDELADAHRPPRALGARVAARARRRRGSSTTAARAASRSRPRP